MPDFKKRTHTGDRRPFSRDAKRGPSFDKKELYSAECNKCHKSCQVPFRPNGKKPVYCNDCFSPDTEFDRKPRLERRPFMKSEAPARTEKDPHIDEVLRRLDSLEHAIEKISDLLQQAARKEELAQEVRKHMPNESAAPATKKVAATAKAKRA